MNNIAEIKQLLDKTVTSKLLTPAELSARWSVSERTLKRWREEGREPAFLRIKQGENRSVIRYPMHDPAPSMKGVIHMELEFLESK